MCNKIFLERVMVEFYADMFGIKSVPILFKGNLHEAVSYIYSQPKSVVAAGKRKMEGIVGLPELIRIYDPLGHRIIIKLKVKDFI